jgi:hypothetical protein
MGGENVVRREGRINSSNYAIARPPGTGWRAFIGPRRSGARPVDISLSYIKPPRAGGGGGAGGMSLQVNRI